MKVFLDTNVIIDFYAQREEFYRPASIIIDLAKRKEIEIVVSATTFVNAFYILRKKYDFTSLYDSADIIVTRNPSDFSQSEIKVSTPIEFLNLYFA